MSEYTLLQLVEQAKFEDSCSQGHDWQSIGGRFCGLWAQHEDGVEGAPTSCQGSQTVYECVRCGDVDYGDPGGPGFEDCQEICGRKV